MAIKFGMRFGFLGNSKYWSKGMYKGQNYGSLNMNYTLNSKFIFHPGFPYKKKFQNDSSIIIIFLLVTRILYINSNCNTKRYFVPIISNIGLKSFCNNTLWPFTVHKAEKWWIFGIFDCYKGNEVRFNFFPDQCVEGLVVLKPRKWWVGEAS